MPAVAHLVAEDERIVGGMLQFGSGHPFVLVFAFIATLVASINVFGGFTVTQRMLSMFTKG